MAIRLFKRQFAFFFLLALPVAETDLLCNSHSPALEKLGLSLFLQWGSDSGFYINSTATLENFAFNDVNV